MRARLAFVPVLALVLIVALSVAARGPAPAASGQSARSAAPDFSVERFSDGRSVSLSDVRGKVVLLYFFFPT
jgi:cytochrome oxidase Cu insertion factor (SCO1/SenC/PrrC family)